MGNIKWGIQFFMMAAAVTLGIMAGNAVYDCLIEKLVIPAGATTEAVLSQIQCMWATCLLAGAAMGLLCYILIRFLVIKLTNRLKKR